MDIFITENLTRFREKCHLTHLCARPLMYNTCIGVLRPGPNFQKLSKVCQKKKKNIRDRTLMIRKKNALKTLENDRPKNNSKNKGKKKKLVLK